MKKQEYLTIVEVLQIHKTLIEKYGGSSGVRDLGALESALFRPQSGYYDNLIEETSALWESLAQNHPFIDGNKRTAFAVVYTFLAINGIQINSTSKGLSNFIYSLYKDNKFEYKELKKWLQRHT